MHAGAMVGLGKNDIRADQECGAPQRGPRLMHAGTERLTAWAAQGAAQQD